MKPIKWHDNDTEHDRTNLSGVDYKLFVVAGRFETGEPIVVTCWKPSWKDIFNIIKNRKIFVSLLTENTLPPLGVCTDLEDIGATYLKEGIQ